MLTVTTYFHDEPPPTVVDPPIPMPIAPAAEILGEYFRENFFYHHCMVTTSESTITPKLHKDFYMVLKTGCDKDDLNYFIKQLTKLKLGLEDKLSIYQFSNTSEDCVPLFIVEISHQTEFHYDNKSDKNKLHLMYKNLISSKKSL